MNERELLKKVSDNEFASRGSELSAAEVLGTSVSSRARVRSGYWKLGLAALGAAAVAVSAAALLSRKTVPADKTAASSPSSAAAEQDDTAAETIESSSSLEEPAQTAESLIYDQILSKMRAGADKTLAYIENGWLEKSAWTKNGETKYGVFHEEHACNYVVVPDEDGSYFNCQVTDPTPVIEFLDLMEENRDKWSVKTLSDSELRSMVNHDDHSPEMKAPSVVFEYCNEDDPQYDTLITYRLDLIKGNNWRAGVIFQPLNENKSAAECITFDFVRESGREYLFDEAGNPRLPGAEEVGRTDTLYAGPDAETISYTYTDPIGVTTDINVNIGRSTKIITVETLTSYTAQKGELDSLCGIVMVPHTNGIFNDTDDPVLVHDYKRDGVSAAIDDPIRTPRPDTVPQITESYTPGEPVRHFYEIYINDGDGDLSELSALPIASNYDTVIDPEYDGLPRHISGGVVIKFAENNNVD